VDSREVLAAATAVLRTFRSIPLAVREELAQEATLRTLVQPDVVHPPAFARQVARRLAIDWQRRTGEVPLPDHDLAIEDGLLRQLEARALLRCLAAYTATAPRGHREAVARLVADECDRGATPAPVDPLERDRWYKQRRRTRTQLREQLAG
jgi:DNA-directed RNA polymerase specialized sigma24 family protein